MRGLISRVHSMVWEVGGSWHGAEVAKGSGMLGWHGEEERGERGSGRVGQLAYWAGLGGGGRRPLGRERTRN
jgi:hypothetical protein